MTAEQRALNEYGLPDPYTFVCPLCTCAIGDDAIRECAGCRADGCDMCITTWDDVLGVLGDLCQRCQDAETGP